MRTLTMLALTAVLALSLAVPAFAVNGSGGTGLAFGDHHATHAQDMTGFSAEMNPGTHTGFAGWEAM